VTKNFENSGRPSWPKKSNIVHKKYNLTYKESFIKKFQTPGDTVPPAALQREQPPHKKCGSFGSNFYLLIRTGSPGPTES
jgi:hypothetical protein